MNDYQHFYIDKIGHTFADPLVAFGLMRILDDLLAAQTEQGKREILLRDRGPYYLITCTPALERTTIENLPYILWPIPIIMTAKNEAQLPIDLPDTSFVRYEAERERVNFYFEAVRKGADAQQLPEKPHRHWDIFRAINPAVLPGYNSLLVDWWMVREAQAQILFLLLDLYSDTPNDYEVAQNAWQQLDKTYGWKIKATATCQQLYNPDQGKGQNRTKATGLSIGNVDNFWLSEWLKAVGFYEAAITRLMRGVKDRKTFVVAPRELTFSESQAIMATFMDKMQVSEMPTRFDILAAIRYTKALLEYFSTEESGMARLMGLQNVKKRIVAGFYTAFYKDLGNAIATMNLAFVALPGWITIRSREDVQLYLNPEIGLLTELEKLVRQFDEEHSDAFTLLQYLRDFVSGDDLTAFFRFTNAFPAYLISQRERGKYAYALSTLFIERLVMSTNPQLGRILESEGFQNIAYAIRQSTVTAQYRKKQGDRKYDVRYGLGQELARKARYPGDFVAELCDFLQKYNAENAQVMETRSGPYRRSIKTTDIDDIVMLVDEFGSETVANLLIAYGYARVSREDDATEEENEA